MKTEVMQNYEKLQHAWQCVFYRRGVLDTTLCNKV